MTINDPTDIAKVVAWYSADHLASLAMSDNTVISTWVNLANPGTFDMVLTNGPTGPKFRSAGGSSGGPSVQFPGGTVGHFLPGNVFSADGGQNIPHNAAELFVNMKSEHDGTDPYPGPWMFGIVSGDPMHLPFTPSGANYCYMKFGMPAGNRPNGTAPVTVSGWHTMRETANIVANGGYRVRWDGGAASGWQTYTGHGSVKMLQTPLVGINAAGGQRARMRLGYMILCNDELTSGEASDLAAWEAANPSGGMPYIPIPGDPENLTATPTSDTVLFEWTAATETDITDGFEVRINGGTIVDVGDTFSHLFTGLTPATTQLPEVRAYNANGYSDWVSLFVDTLDAPYLDSDYTARIRIGAHTWTIEAGDTPDPGDVNVLAAASFTWTAPDNVGWPPPVHTCPRDVCTLRLFTPDAAAVGDIKRGDIVRFAFTPTGYPLSVPLVDFAGTLRDVRITDRAEGGAYLQATAIDHLVTLEDWVIPGTTVIADAFVTTRAEVLETLSEVLSDLEAAFDYDQVPGTVGNVLAPGYDPMWFDGAVPFDYTIDPEEYALAAFGRFGMGLTPLPNYDDDGELDEDYPFLIRFIDPRGIDFLESTVDAGITPTRAAEWRRGFTPNLVDYVDEGGLGDTIWTGDGYGAPRPAYRDWVYRRGVKVQDLNRDGISNEFPEPGAFAPFAFTVRASRDPSCVEGWFTAPDRWRRYVTIDGLDPLKNPSGETSVSGMLKGATWAMEPDGVWSVTAGLRPSRAHTDDD